MPGKLVVETAERGAAIARDKGSRTKSGAPIGAVLIHRQAHKHLNAGDQNRTVFSDVFRFE